MGGRGEREAFGRSGEYPQSLLLLTARTGVCCRFCGLISRSTPRHLIDRMPAGEAWYYRNISLNDEDARSNWFGEYQWARLPYLTRHDACSWELNRWCPASVSWPEWFEFEKPNAHYGTIRIPPICQRCMWFVSFQYGGTGEIEAWDDRALVCLQRLVNNAAFKQRLRDNAGNAVRQREVDAFPEDYRKAEFEHWSPKTQALIEQQEKDSWRIRMAEHERALALLAEYMASETAELAA